MTKKLTSLVFSGLWFATPLLMAQAPQPASLPELPAAAQAQAAIDSAKPSALTSELFYELLVGEISAQEGQPAAGYALYLDAARKTNDEQLYQRATDIALQSRSGDAALQSARAWKEAAPRSREANRYVLQILVALNRAPETASLLKTELELAADAERPATIASLPAAYARVNDKKLVASVVEEAVAPYLNDASKAAVYTSAWTTVARLKLAAGDSAGALDAAQKAQAADLRAETPVLVALELMDPKRPAAEELVKKYLADNIKALPEIRMAYARALLDAQRYAEASVQLQQALRDKPDFAPAYLVLGSLQLQDNKLAEAQTAFEGYLALALKQAPEEEATRGIAQAYLSLAQIAEKRKDFAGAEAWIAKIDNPEALLQAQTRRASILAGQGKLEEGRQLIRSLPERTPVDAKTKLLAEIGLLRDVKQYQLAHDLLEQATAKYPDETDLLYDQAMMAEKLGRLAQMEALLKRVIVAKPDHHSAYNALGYSLADRNMRLNEARELIQKALQFAPADPFIKDSLGWVEFRLGNTTEAAKIFEDAYNARPDPEIAAHYGEVLWSLGQRDRARAIWREGQLLGPDNETLTETLKRLQVKP